MIYDVNTKNRSFLEMSYKLYENDIKNNKFMLALYDEDLVGVDPTDPNLTATMKAKIYAEICQNFWYFIREVAMVPQEGTSGGINFQLNVGNMAAAYCCTHNINHLLVLPRQVGKTVVEVMFSLWVYAFAGSYISETYLHKSQSGSIDNLARFKKYKELLPLWLIDLISDKQDKDNLEEKYSEKRKNRIQGLSSAASDSAADKLGRGSSTALVYLDEFAFLERNRIVMNALVPAWSTSAEVAKQNNAPYGIRITTTPNTLSLDQAQYCHDNFLTPSCKFTFSIYDVPENELHEYVGKNSSNDFVFIQYSWKECGKTEDWFRKQCRLINDELIIKRELLCIWPESSEGNVFTEKQLDTIKYFVKPIVATITINGYAVNFYEKPELLTNYIMSCDVAGGLTLDRSVITFIHPGDFHVVGLFKNERIDTEEFKQLIRALATEYFIHAIINIENNSYGKNIIDALMKDPVLEPRMYRETMERQAEKTLNNGVAVKQKTKKVVYGVNTNGTTRKLMYEMLPTIVDEEPEVFVSDDFYDEVKNLVRNKKGKVEARVGCHDDIVMSYLITRYALVYGKCFSERFHIASIATPNNVKNGGYTETALLRDFSNLIDNANAYDYTDNSINADNIIAMVLDMKRKDIKYTGQQEEKPTDMYDLIYKLNDIE